MGEPVVDHSGLGIHAEIVDRELAERPAPVAEGARSDLENERLAPFSWERAEVVVHVLDELEVDEGLSRWRHPPLLLVRADVVGTQHVARVPVHRDDRIERASVLPVEAEHRRRSARVVPSGHADCVRRGA